MRTVSIDDRHGERNDELIFASTRQLRVDPNDVIILERDVVVGCVHRHGEFSV